VQVSVSGLRAERPIEIRVAMSEAARSGVIFFKTSSDGILTSDVVPSQFIISVDDIEKKTNLYRRHEDTAQSAHGRGGEVGVQELVKSYEAKSSPRSGSASPVASTGAPAAPPKIEGPKTPPKADAPKTPPKEGASAPSAPEVPKAVTAAVEPAKEDEPAKKKAALSIVPAAVPAASSAAAFLELFRRLRFQRPVQKNKRFLLQDPHHQSRLQAQSHLCRKRSLALKVMTNHQRRTSRCRSRLRPNNVNDVLQKPSKDNLNVTSAE